MIAKHRFVTRDSAAGISDLMRRMEEERNFRQPPKPEPWWPCLVTALLLVVLAIIFGLCGIARVPSWSAWCSFSLAFVFTFAAGLVVRKTKG